MITLDPKDFPTLEPEDVEELQAEALRMERAAQRRQNRRLGRVRQPATIIPQEDAPPYPPDPYWGTDERGRFRYVDYDGESLQVRYEDDGDLWIDKHGEGPVYIRREDIPVIVAALTARGNHVEN